MTNSGKMFLEIDLDDWQRLLHAANVLRVMGQHRSADALTDLLNREVVRGQTQTRLERRHPSGFSIIDGGRVRSFEPSGRNL